MNIARLGPQHEAAAVELLDEDPVQNLFLLGFLDEAALERAYWYGALDGDRVRGLVMVLPGRLAVPWSPDEDAAFALGDTLRRRHHPTMMVGPRAHTDRIWSRWGHGADTRCYYDQELYLATSAPPGPRMRGFRRAVASEWPVLARFAAEMELEDLGRDPRIDDGELHERLVQDRAASGRTLVVERSGELVFQINLGTTSPRGCQVGGTYVPPEHRGHGLATEAMREVVRRLVPRYGLVTLHVNGANRPAVRVYEKSGFRRVAPFRLITLA